jgi:hypothetical protein
MKLSRQGRRHPEMGGVIMKWLARRDAVYSTNPSHSEGEWRRWFAWHPVTIATSRRLTRWVWLEFVERKWSTSRYGNGTRRRYRLSHNSKDVRRRLHNLKELTLKLDAALGQSKPSDTLRRGMIVAVCCVKAPAAWRCSLQSAAPRLLLVALPPSVRRSNKKCGTTG